MHAELAAVPDFTLQRHSRQPVIAAFCRKNKHSAGVAVTHNPYESPSTDGGTTSPTLREQTPVRRWSFALTCVLVNFAIWQIGVFFNSFGGVIDQLGASLCILTWFVAPLLIVGALIYSPFRRFGLAIQTWISMDLPCPSSPMLS